MSVKAQALYPYLSINGEYLDKQFLDDAWRHLIRKAYVWGAGLEEPSPTDRLAYAVLKQITMRMPEEAP